jgi:tetratricopeptide (TPR) repeat protein
MPFHSCILRVFLFSVAIFPIAASSYAQVALPSESYDLNFSKGLAEFELRQYDSAEKFFRKALEAKPGDPEAAFYLGQSLTRAKKYGEAEAVFRRLLEMKPGSGRAYLGLGIVLYNQERYREALNSLALAEKASPNEALVYYYQGLSHYRLAEYEQAPARFVRAMSLGPDLSASAHYFSGLAYHQQGVLDEAQAEFEEAQKLEPESELGRSAAAYLEQIRAGVALQPQKKRWDLTFSINSQWDDNVVLLPSGFSPPAGPTGISKSHDYRTTLYLRGEVRAFEQGPFVAGASYALYQSFHRTLSAFDVESHTPTFFVQHTAGPVQTRLQYIYDYVLVGRSPFLIAHSIAPLITIQGSPTLLTQVLLKYQDLDFQHGRFLFNSFRDGHDWLASAMQYWFFAKNTGHVRVGYTYDEYITAGKDVSLALQASAADWAYRGHKASVGVSVPPFYSIYSITLDAGFDYYVQLYDNASSFSPGGSVLRTDKVFNYYATATWKLTDHLWLGLQYVHTDDNSNIDAFTYTRNIYGVVLTGQF